MKRTILHNNNSHILSETLYYDSKSQTGLFRFKIFPESKRFCNKPTPLYSTQYPDPFITYNEGLNMHTGKHNPLQLPEDEQYTTLSTQLISGKLIHNLKNSFFLP